MIEQKLEGNYKNIAKIQDAEQDALLQMSNVVGVGVGNKIKADHDTGEPSLVVFVSQKLDPDLLKTEDQIPSSIAKIKTDVIETGDIFAGGCAQEVSSQVEEEQEETAEEEAGVQLLKTRLRPVEGGHSVGHYRITAGTYATAVCDAKPYPGIPQKYYVLSNNHVLANSNNARIGDPILQPGPYDGGTYPRDVIARLSRFVPIRFKTANSAPCNYVDAAIAEGPFHWLDREIFWIGYVKGVAGVSIGALVQKTGRTTNYTTGKVLSVNATVDVNYGGSRVARFCRQILTTNMSAGGDSGSLLCDMNENAVGLLFAGSSRVTIHNYIGYVQALLGIRVV